MLIPEILLLTGLALVIRLLGRSALRGWLVLAASVICIYWLQPAMPIRYLDFWLPTATLALTVISWLLTTPGEAIFTRENALAGGLIAGLVLLTGLTRYIGPGDWLTAGRPPAYPQVLAALAGMIVITGALALAKRKLSQRAALDAEGTQKPGQIIPAALGGAIIILIALLIALKAPPLALLSAQGLRAWAGQNPALATALDIRWLGFSYVCFRLIHTLRDRQTGRLPTVNLQAYASYVVFFPSFVAGPIDRLERFTGDFCRAVKPLTDPQAGEDLQAAGRRLAVGLFKKFAIADTLALVALNPQNASQVNEAGWMWLLLYFYAFQIYFDFSGYTDIAIGLGMLLGIKLPENFAAPYLKPNLTQFWNSWHMTLTQWFRAYYFNPLVRWLRKRKKDLSPSLVLLLTQVTTMLLIGLWHGVTVNFVLWGLWHGLGLFVQNRWTDLTRGWFAARNFSPGQQRAMQVFSTLLTFHFVALGWVFFVLPSPELAGKVLLTLFGM
ncbi:MAG: MBOAT family protein [Chloroflexi bacterium]|nr:MBOAT family protein [Chloroflexota bacterium]